jgi:hypothetical protein
METLSPARYKVQFTASAELRDKLERLQALMRPSVPDGDLAKIIEEAVTEKLERLESQRFGKTKAPGKGLAGARTTPSSRHIPAPIRRAVYERDGGRCTYVDEQGRRCTARKHLEFHHDDPFGRGGAHSLKNIRLACRSHNLHLAELAYGREKMGQYRRGPDRILERAAVYAVGQRTSGGRPSAPAPSSAPRPRTQRASSRPDRPGRALGNGVLEPPWSGASPAPRPRCGAP